MVASRQVEIPFYRGIGQQRGRGFSAIAQVFGRTAIPFLRKYIVPVAKRLGADLPEFAVPEIADAVSGRKNFKTAAKSVGRQAMRKRLGSGSRTRIASRVIPTQSAKETGRPRRVFCEHFPLIMSSNFRYEPFVAVSGTLEAKSQ